MVTGFESAAQLLPQPMQKMVLQLPVQLWPAVQELRFRVQRPVAVVIKGTGHYLCSDGSLAPLPSKADWQLTQGGLQSLFMALCRYSVHIYEETLAEGYIPLEGGHRAGVCGSAVYRRGELLRVEGITSINLRIASAQTFPLPALLKPYLEPAYTGGLLIAGPPASGKTSLLRSILWNLEALPQQVTVVDERKELLPNYGGHFLGSVPANCDVLSGYRKSQGLLQAVRLLSPSILLCDEIGGEAEARAITEALQTGVKIIASLHGATLEGLRQRPQAKAVLQTGAFSAVAFLASGAQVGQCRTVEVLHHAF